MGDVVGARIVDHALSMPQTVLRKQAQSRPTLMGQRKSFANDRGEEFLRAKRRATWGFGTDYKERPLLLLGGAGPRLIEASLNALFFARLKRKKIRLSGIT